jgi:hypothetical protein
MKKSLNIGLVGYGFMGRTHSNAFRQAPIFFDLPWKPVLKAVAARNADRVKSFAGNWGYESYHTDWRDLVARPDIDLIDIATGRAQKTFESLRLWEPGLHHIRVKSTANVMSRHYVRLTVADEPGVLAEVSRDLASEGISISSVIQHEAIEGPELPAVPLVIMTHTAATGRLLTALARINEHKQVREPAVYYPVGE